MKVVCDTSPICYLLLIEEVDILPQLFSQVIVPQAVRDELLAEGSLAIIQNWISQPPSWLDIQIVTNPLLKLPKKLGMGEREAISLAVNIGGSLIVLDDFEARQVAISLKLTVTGLLGVLYRAATQGLLNLPNTLERLQQTTFRASPTLQQSFLERYQKSLEEN